MSFSLVFIITALSPAAVAVAGTWLSYKYLYWNVPRRKPFVPSVLLALAASYMIYWAVTHFGDKIEDRPKLILVIAASLIGVITALFVAVKVGTPAHASVVIVCDYVGVPNQVDDDGRAGSSEEREKNLRGFREKRGLTHPAPPTVWPDHFFVAQEGSVSWFIYGEPHTRVKVIFNKDYDPFSSVKNRNSHSEFIGVIPDESKNVRVPGVIVAGPVVRGGRGGYTIMVTYPDGSTKTIDPDGEGPRKHA